MYYRWRVSDICYSGNEKQLELILVLQEMISGTLDTYAEDPSHAPAAWLLENWWHALNAALACSEVGNHLDNKSDSFKATDEAESKKGHEHIESDESFKV